VRTLCALAASILIVAASLDAQTNSGAIQGSVLDPSGAAIAGATVTARNLNTGLTVTVKSSDAGVYLAPNLPPGQYSVTVES